MATPAPARPRELALLGSTGSIGQQALEVVRAHPDRLRVHALVASRSIQLLAHQCREFSPPLAVVSGEQQARELASLVRSSTRVLWGDEGLQAATTATEVDVVLLAITGFAAVRPALWAAQAGKLLALASKEALVAAGHLLTRALAEGGGAIVPVDSEHSALYQLLQGRERAEVRSLVLTASGGALRDLPLPEVRQAIPEQALRHPTWQMGPKVTIDSASLMNKALEIIEAKWLFGFDLPQIRVVIHPQSVVHSLVELVDGAYLVHLGLPDMRVPIQYALLPERAPSPPGLLDLCTLSALTFQQPDRERYPCLQLGYRAAEEGGCAPAVLNAANEQAVGLFLERRIPFGRIHDLVAAALDRNPHSDPSPDLDTLTRADAWGRQFVLGAVAQ